MSDTDKLQKQVEEDRRRLTASLSGLSDTVAPQTLGEQLSAAAHGLSGEFSRQALTAAKRNPVALVMAGAGLALMFANNTARTQPRQPAPPTAVPPEQAFIGFYERVEAADAAMKKEMTGMSTESYRTSKMRETLNAGLESLPESARKRVLKARKAAIKAQEQVEAHAAHAAAQSRTYYNQNPLSAGAIALGLGALIGAMIPSTRREDELLGTHRDALAAKAEAALHEEMDRLHEAASASLKKSTARDPNRTALN
ncbi:hypothetical protein N6L24_06145 [Cognatishimia sp. SS12]|uniref:hypothetical protein n=1 Tax=Cognatishimia sp. SS12 TaxID=2979465 RepID=UPI00232E2F64|nr:hypothetical protein [Cognatishimia sp. SS12]MDC0737850.1 hypothetical protein [Cognatishimia sp. SS12]